MIKIRFIPVDFSNGDYTFDSYWWRMPYDIGDNNLNCWYFDCTLPCIPAIGDGVDFQLIDVYSQVSKQLDICKPLRDFMTEWRANNAINFLTLEEVLIEFFKGRNFDGFNSGFWHVKRVNYIAGDEFVNVEIEHDL